MGKRFIKLTDTQNDPVLIGLANVVTIKKNPLNSSNTLITFNVSHFHSNEITTEVVKESVNEIMKMMEE
jgi:hypothetical protein